MYLHIVGVGIIIFRLKVAHQYKNDTDTPILMAATFKDDEMHKIITQLTTVREFDFS